MNRWLQEGGWGGQGGAGHRVKDDTVVYLTLSCS